MFLCPAPRVVRREPVFRYQDAAFEALLRHVEWVWRLVTPIFLHWGIIHIIFNMWWLRDLGSMIEARKNTWFLLLLVLVIAAVSNLAQYGYKDPYFGGMSGVVYGLLGYIWMRSKHDPGCGLFLHSTTVTMMMVWFFLCFTGMVGHIANTNHGVGLVTGMVWGYLAAGRKIFKRS